MTLQDRQTEIFDKYGVFFAFSQRQYNEKAVQGVDYTSLGAGMVAPKKNATDIINALESVHNDHVKADLAEHGKKAIIHRELANYEAQITYEIDDTVDALECYGITRDEIQKEFKSYMDYCIEHDLF